MIEKRTLSTQNNNIHLHAFILGSYVFFCLWLIFTVFDPQLQMEVFFRDRNDVFMDFFNCVKYSDGLTPYNWGVPAEHNLLPLTYVVMYPLAAYVRHIQNASFDSMNAYAMRSMQIPAIACAAFMIISFALMFYALYHASKRTEKEKLLLLGAFAISAPFLFNIDRANTLILAIPLCFIFFQFHDSSNVKLKHLGLICLAIAAALKIYPAMFGILLLRDKKWKDAVYAILYGIFFAIAPFFFLKGGFVNNVLWCVECMKEHALAYGHGPIGFYVKPFNLFKVFPAIISYAAFVAAMLSALIMKKSWKLYALISLAYLLTSGFQGYYCVMMLFYAIIVFFNEEHKTSDLLYVLFFIIIVMTAQFNFKLSISGNDRYINNTFLTNLACIAAYLWIIAECWIGFIKRKRAAGAAPEKSPDKI